MAGNQEVSKQLAFALLGQTSGQQITKQLVFDLAAYPYQDISKQVVYPILNDPGPQVSKQVVYAILEQRVTNLGRRTSSSSYTFKSTRT